MFAGDDRAAAYAPHGSTVTVPSGCSQVIVPVDMKVGCDGIPLTNWNDITSVQSYRARPCVPGASNRRPPVLCMVAVTLDRVPSAPRTKTSSPVIERYGSPLSVTVCDRQSLNSMRDDIVTVPDGPAGVAASIDTASDPPSGQVITLDTPSGDVLSTPVACVSAAPMMPCAKAGLRRVGGVAVEGADGEPPPQPTVRPARMTGARIRCARTADHSIAVSREFQESSVGAPFFGHIAEQGLPQQFVG